MKNGYPECMWRRCWRTGQRITLTEDDMWESSRFNEVRKLCYNDSDAWKKCVWTATAPDPLTKHFVRRSKRRVGTVTPVVTPNPGSLEATHFLGVDGIWRRI